MTITEIIEAVSVVFGESSGEISGRCRKWPLVGARFAVWLILADKGMSKRALAKQFGVDPAAIRNGLRRGRELIETDMEYARKIKRCLNYENDLYTNHQTLTR